MIKFQLKSIKYKEQIFALIDDEDLELVSKISWSPRWDTNTFYAHGGDRNGVFKEYHGSNKRGRTVQMHRIIMGAKPGEFVDHINHNGLDNRKCNLRLCSALENARNGRSAKNANSKYLGVWYEPPRGGRKDRYRSAIRVNRKLINLCSTQNEKEAAFAYNAAALKYFGEFASINIINRDYEL